MSENATRTYSLIAACAMRDKVGVVATIKFMRKHGWDTTEAIDMIAMYEDLQEQVKKGLLPES